MLSNREENKQPDWVAKVLKGFNMGDIIFDELYPSLSLGIIGPQITEKLTI
jgi:hypothetical protein